MEKDFYSYQVVTNLYFGQILLEIARLCNRKASILGFNSFATLTLTQRMALNGGIALNFINDLHKKHHYEL